MNIRILNEADAQIYQSLRLRGLQTDPESFGSTYEREVNFPIEAVEERIRQGEDRFVLGAFNEEGSLVGVVRFMRATDRKSRHKGDIYGMYVAPEVRGQGVGKALMMESITRAKDFDGVEQIHLQVVSKNKSAKKLYQSLGFETYGVEPRGLKEGDEYFDEDLMVLFLKLD
ncbi:GNAT family N-acetyltransferase [Lysinibacillus sp. SGAir0095]|uniref:GNAT family N-acetyltransferase n=1 Tax=Lysinibacillus sp. SGAir0095 TaxID=2070463 RepID=UPI0010CD31CC|nr:GNAT family N-acetyltransferase [Lysinibacillus sp. SGAir0095]QCR31036.1 GNAT family N-acetyltransferase [Lysinibacillus sp. SGAir0095]